LQKALKLFWNAEHVEARRSEDVVWMVTLKRLDDEPGVGCNSADFCDPCAFSRLSQESKKIAEGFEAFSGNSQGS
jgi:hypothetical protein